jgi:hypothetical protein
MSKICVKILIILQQSICQVLDDKAFNNQLDEDEGFVSGVTTMSSMCVKIFRYCLVSLERDSKDSL